MKPLGPYLRDLALVGAAAFVLRVAFVIVQSVWRPFDVAFVATDSALYIGLADALGSGAGYTIDGHPTAYVGPGYPMFLAPLRVAGLDTVGIGLVQSVLGAVTACAAGATAAYLPYTAGSPLSRRALVLGAAVICAVYPHLVFWTGYVLTETLFVLLVALSLLLIVASLTLQRPALALASGLAAAGAALTRSPFLAVAVVLVLWLAYLAARRAAPLAIAALFALGLASPQVLWTARNAIELGAPVLTSTHSGWVFYQANSAGSTGGSGGYLGAVDFIAIEPPAGLTEAQRDAYYYARTVDDIRADPAAYIARTGTKLWNMWRPTYDGSSVRNSVVTLATYFPLLLLGIVGAVVLARAMPVPVGAIPVMTLAIWVLLHLVVGGMIRYRLSAEYVLAITAPFGLAFLLGPLARAPSAAR